MFKLLIVTAFVAIASAATTSSSDRVDGYLIERQYLTPTAMTVSLVSTDEVAADPVCPEGAKGNLCADDCKTLLACVTGNTTPLITNLCSDLSSSSPYCIPGKTGCSAAGNASIATCAAAPTFTCTNTGYFPDPTNCTIYHICTESTADTYQCPPNYVYDSATFKCKVKRYSSDCVTIGCTTTTANKYVVYSANKAYYAFCGLTSGVSKITMFRCEDIANFQFNPTTISCDFVCKTEGWFSDYSNCQNYYECYKSGTKLVNNIQTCPTSTVFNATQRICVSGTTC